MTIDSAELGRILLGLLEEAHVGPENPRMTWFADNEEGSGLVGTLSRLTAAEASKPLPPHGSVTAATHAGHVRFALNLANRALRGENAHATANWKDSWKYRSVDEGAWKELLEGLRAEHAALKDAVTRGLCWNDPMNLNGVFGQLAHGAWHLGALRQALGLVKVD